MQDEPVPRNLPERTGRHYCIQCLAEVPADEYFGNDCLCDACARQEEVYPLQSTPEEKKER